MLPGFVGHPDASGRHPRVLQYRAWEKTTLGTSLTMATLFRNSAAYQGQFARRKLSFDFVG
jgi:hypothetical protein